MHVFMLSSSCKSPISYCMLPFADLQLNAEHELKGGGVPSPEGLQLEGGLRSADLNLRIEICVMEFCFESDTPALVYDKGGGFNRYAHSAGPGYRRRELNLEQFGRKSIDEHRMASAWRSGESVEDPSKIDRKLMERRSTTYRKSIENLSKIYRTSIENLSNIYRKSIEHLSKI